MDFSILDTLQRLEDMGASRNEAVSTLLLTEISKVNQQLTEIRENLKANSTKIKEGK